MYTSGEKILNTIFPFEIFTGVFENYFDLDQHFGSKLFFISF